MCCKHICFIVWQPLGPCPLVRSARSPELGQRVRASGCVSGGTDNSSPAPPRLTNTEKKPVCRGKAFVERRGKEELSSGLIPSLVPCLLPGVGVWWMRQRRGAAGGFAGRVGRKERRVTVERQQIWDGERHSSVSIACSSFPAPLFLPLGTRSDPILCDRRAEIPQPACDSPASHKRTFPALSLETS